MRNLMFIATIILALTGCKKDEVVGPQGAQGPQGEQGNANVESMDFSIFTSDWEGSPAEGWEATIEWDELTDEVVNEGGVFIYMALAEDSYTSLPITLPAGSGFVSIISAFTNGEMGVIYLPGGGVQLNNPGLRQCRAIIVGPKSMALGDDHVQKLINQELAK